LALSVADCDEQLLTLHSGLPFSISQLATSSGYVIPRHSQGAVANIGSLHAQGDAKQCTPKKTHRIRKKPVG